MDNIGAYLCESVVSFDGQLRCCNTHVIIGTETLNDGYLIFIEHKYKVTKDKVCERKTNSLEGFANNPRNNFCIYISQTCKTKL